MTQSGKDQQLNRPVMPKMGPCIVTSYS